MGDLRPSSNDLVVSVKHTVCVVAWMAVNQSVWFSFSVGKLDSYNVWLAYSGRSIDSPTAKAVLVWRRYFAINIITREE